jgi:hypothetical protein
MDLFQCTDDATQLRRRCAAASQLQGDTQGGQGRVQLRVATNLRSGDTQDACGESPPISPENARVEISANKCKCKDLVRRHAVRRHGSGARLQAAISHMGGGVCRLHLRSGVRGERPRLHLRAATPQRSSPPLSLTACICAQMPGCGRHRGSGANFDTEKPLFTAPFPATDPDRRPAAVTQSRIRVPPHAAVCHSRGACSQMQMARRRYPSVHRRCRIRGSERKCRRRTAGGDRGRRLHMRAVTGPNISCRGRNRRCARPPAIAWRCDDACIWAQPPGMRPRKSLFIL